MPALSQYSSIGILKFITVHCVVDLNWTRFKFSNVSRVPGNIDYEKNLIVFLLGNFRHPGNWLICKTNHGSVRRNIRYQIPLLVQVALKLWCRHNPIYKPTIKICFI